jgi:hypothetical protein
LDSNSGWSKELTIKLFSIDHQEYQDINIGSSEYNKKLGFIDCDVSLYKSEYTPQLIPRRIMQTSFTNQIYSIQHENAIYSFLELNPDYEYEFFNDQDCRSFIATYFDKNCLKAYDLLIPKAFKSDLFRLCYLYIKGGCYFDNKHVLRMPLSKIISPEFSNLFCTETFPGGLHNGVICSVPGDDDLYRCILSIISNTLSQKMEEHSLAFTGPIKLYQFAKHKNIKLRFKRTEGLSEFNHDRIYFSNQLVINRSYIGYYSLKHRLECYNKLFENKSIYYQNYIDDGEFIYMTTPIIIDQKIYKMINSKRSLRRNNFMVENKKTIKNISITKKNDHIEIESCEYNFNLIIINKKNNEIKKYKVHPFQKKLYL